jgi:patatin-like phospholipase/acyl hydrolase
MRLSEKVFELDKVLMGIIPQGDDACRFDYQKLEQSMRDMIKDTLNDPDAKLEELRPEANHVPVFVVATKGLHADNNPTLFRSYRCRGYNANKCFIWEAARATSAAPTLFKPITIKVPPPDTTFVDGGLTYNNPGELALQEARRIWSDSADYCLVSIGTGRLGAVEVITTADSQSSASSWWKSLPGVKNISNTMDGTKAIKDIARACVSLATNSEPAHQRLLSQAYVQDSSKRFLYHRFNVERDMQDIGLAEWARWEEMAAHTAAYMEAGEGVFKRDRCVEDLLGS